MRLGYRNTFCCKAFIIWVSGVNTDNHDRGRVTFTFPNYSFLLTLSSQNYFRHCLCCRRLVWSGKQSSSGLDLCCSWEVWRAQSANAVSEWEHLDCFDGSKLNCRHILNDGLHWKPDTTDTTRKQTSNSWHL